MSRSARSAPPAVSKVSRIVSSGAPIGATLSRSGHSKRMKSWKTAVMRRRHASMSSVRMSTPSTSMAPPSGSYSRHSNFASVVLPAPLRPTIANDVPAGIVRSRCFSTAMSEPGYANVTSRRRTSHAGIAETDTPDADADADGCGGGPSAPASAIIGRIFATALTGDAAPSRAQFRPPNAMLDVPIAACANATAAPSESRPPASEAPSVPNTTALPARTIATLANTGRSRSRVASYCSSCMRRRRAMNRATTQSAMPNSRTSLAAGASVAPDAALPKQPMRRQPRAREDERRPPRVAEQHDRAGQSAEHRDETIRDEVHRNGQRRALHAQVEISSGDHVGRQASVLEMTDAGRIDASVGEPIIQPGRSAIAEVLTHRLMYRRQHLHGHEHESDEAERHGKRMTAGDRGDELAHREANAAGSTPRASNNVHHAMASRRCACR